MDAVECFHLVVAGVAAAHAVEGLGGGLAHESGRRAAAACFIVGAGPGLAAEATVGALAASSRSRWQEMTSHHIEAAARAAARPASVASTAWPFASGLAAG